MAKLKVKKGDLVEMITGKDRGKRGKVLEVRPEGRRILIDGLNLVRKHQKPKKAGKKGEIITLPRAVDISNAMLVCSSCGKTARMGFSLRDGKRMRVCKKCKSEF